jgi:hypothetical protein
MKIRENGGTVTRPRAADDFAAIRARMEELRREREQVVADRIDRTPIDPRLYHHRRNGETEQERSELLPRSVLRFIR